MPPEKNSGVSKAQLAVVLLFALVISGIVPIVYGQKAGKIELTIASSVNKAESISTTDATEIERCKVPKFAKKYLIIRSGNLHNNCK
jgi:hypothetical protein